MKERLDVLLVKKNLAESREKAKAVIMAGIVYVDDQKEDKAGSMFEETAKIEVRGSTLKYVSRGGLKLEKAMTHFGVTLDQKICMDVGASTGGFTDCMLQNGAVKVYSVDVGHGQLAWKLRNDPRVVCMEKTNIRYVTPEEIPDKIQFVSIDVSFISLTKVLGPVKALMEPDGQVVCLIKPQFEAGREKVGKKGVVRERSVHLEVIRMVAAFAGSIGFEALHLEFSPIKGPEGNIEYLLHLRNDAGGNVYENSSIDAEEIVNQAHETLDYEFRREQHMKHFYIIVNEDKEDTKAMGARITRYLEDHGCTFRTSKGVFSKGKRFTSVSDVPEDTECVITLGGDGTFIQAARDLAGTGLPIVGINLGDLGYLTQMGKGGNLEELLDALLSDG